MQRALLAMVTVTTGMLFAGNALAQAPIQAPEEIEENMPFTIDTLWALEDFDLDVEGFVPFYEEPQRLGVAINSILYENAWGAADHVWQGASGFFNITIATMPEFDGECHYRLYVNEVPQGDQFQNPETVVLIAHPRPAHTWRGVQLNAGDTLRVTANTCSSDLIPEGDGYAWARARWAWLQLRQLD